jgi:Cu-processing system ATP-binding protein
VEQRVDRVAVMHRGSLLASGTLDQLRAGVVADVELRVRAASADPAPLLARLPAGSRCAASVASTLALCVPAAGKMAALRALAAMDGEVLDIDTTTTGLEELYRRLVQQEAGAA